MDANDPMDLQQYLSVREQRAVASAEADAKSRKLSREAWNVLGGGIVGAQDDPGDWCPVDTIRDYHVWDAGEAPDGLVDEALLAEILGE